MVRPPVPEHQDWDTVRHPKFPAEGWYTKISNSQKRRLQRKQEGSIQTHGIFLTVEEKPLALNSPPPRAWYGLESKRRVRRKKNLLPCMGGKEAKEKLLPRQNGKKEISAPTTKEQKEELKKSLKQKMEEFQKVLMSDNEEEDMLDDLGLDQNKEDKVEEKEASEGSDEISFEVGRTSIWVSTC